jgi:hypothetical protein
MNAPTTTASSLAHLEQNVRFWQTQSARLERDRKNLAYMLYAAAPVFGLAYLALHHVGIASALGGLCLTVWGMGLYMTSVRRGEYAFALKEAQDELEAARLSSSPGPA